MTSTSQVARSHHERILIIFLEYGNEAVTVHDVLHERHGEERLLRLGSYPPRGCCVAAARVCRGGA